MQIKINTFSSFDYTPYVKGSLFLAAGLYATAKTVDLIAKTLPLAKKIEIPLMILGAVSIVALGPVYPLATLGALWAIAYIFSKPHVDSPVPAQEESTFRNTKYGFLVDSPINATPTQQPASEFENEFPFLKQCGCHFIPPVIRRELEKQTLAAVQEKFQNKDQPITIVSVGAGQCLQELIYLVKLVDCGYKNIRLVLIEREFDATKHPESSASNALQNLRNFKEKYLKEATVDIQPYSSLENYGEALSEQTGLKPHLLLLIDLDENILDNFLLKARDFFWDKLSPGTVISATNRLSEGNSDYNYLHCSEFSQIPEKRLSQLPSLQKSGDSNKYFIQYASRR
jgi:hypothetical protein